MLEPIEQPCPWRQLAGEKAIWIAYGQVDNFYVWRRCWPSRRSFEHAPYSHMHEIDQQAIVGGALFAPTVHPRRTHDGPRVNRTRKRDSRRVEITQGD